MESYTKEYEISKIRGEFKDKIIEREYLKNDAEEKINNLIVFVLGFGIIYFLFLIPDFFVIEERGLFIRIFLLRIFVLLGSIIVYFRIKSVSDYFKLYIMVTHFELISSISLLYVIYIYRGENVYLQTISIIIFLILLFSIPNRSIYSIVISIIYVASFFIIYRNVIFKLEPNEYGAIITDILLIYVIITFYNLMSNYYKRVRFRDNKNLEKISTTDFLTGINNRMKFDMELNNILKSSPMNFSMAFFDIDDFKLINDNFGHTVGDKVIVELSSLIKKMLPENCMLSRWGGDEFTILFMGYDRFKAMEVCKDLKCSIAENHFSNDARITISIGLTQYDKDDYNSIIKKADKALYEAKKSGKNSICTI